LAAARRATNAQVLEDAERLIAAWNERSDPERFHIEKSEIEATLAKLARRFGVELRGRQAPKRPIVTTEVIAGGRVILQKPWPPFAIFVGTPKADASRDA
jgi:hypothetical protein